MLYLHGGGWSVGTRRRFGRATIAWDPTAMRRVANSGLAIASIDYRLVGEAVFPAPLNDCLAALAWLRSRGAELGIDPSRIAVWGESAGGHLAYLVGLTASGLRGVAGWYAPTDLTGAAPGSPENTLTGGDAELAQAASPIHHVHAGAPPFQIHHGTADTMVPIDHSERFVATLRAVGAPDVEAIFESTLAFASRVTAAC